MVFTEDCLWDTQAAHYSRAVILTQECPFGPIWLCTCFPKSFPLNYLVELIDTFWGCWLWWTLVIKRDFRRIIDWCKIQKISRILRILFFSSKDRLFASYLWAKQSHCSWTGEKAGCFKNHCGYWVCSVVFIKIGL